MQGGCGTNPALTQVLVREPRPPRPKPLPSIPLDIIIRQTYEKLQVVFIHVHNLGVEVSQLRAETQKLRSVVLTLLADPQAREDALAVLKEYGTSKNTHVKDIP